LFFSEKRAYLANKLVKIKYILEHFSFFSLKNPFGRRVSGGGGGAI